jgi:predicted metal-dependent phosphoesterase TrpH
MQEIAVLHAHPHFYRPKKCGQKRTLDEIAFTAFRPIPTLPTIVDNIFRRGIGICALSACHTPTSGIDTRFKTYMKQLDALDTDFDVDTHLGEGWLQISRKVPKPQEPTHVVLLHSQETRTDYRGLPADINILGIPYLVPHAEDIDRTAQTAIEHGGIVLGCHVNSPNCSMGYKKALEMIHRRKLHNLEGYNATENPEVNAELGEMLDRDRIYGPAVPDAHHHSQIEAAYIRIPQGYHERFSISGLRDLLSVYKPEGSMKDPTEYQFANSLGQISKAGKFVDHTLPILMSLPEQFIKNPMQIIGALTRRAT